MNRRKLLLTTAISALCKPSFTNAQSSTPATSQGSWLANLPVGVAFNTITSPTSSDLAGAALLASVSRNTWGADASIGGICFDPSTGGPMIVIVEEGTLRLSSYDSQELWIDELPADQLPQAYLSENPRPVTIIPGTRLSLDAGESTLLPYGSSCGRYGDASGDPVTFLEVTLLPGQSRPPTNHPNLGMSGEALDINFGSATVNQSAPDSVIAGRLEISAGTTWAFDDIDVPLALLVESGLGDVAIDSVGGLLRDRSMQSYVVSTPIAEESSQSVGTGSMLYIPPSTIGALVAVERLAMMLITVNL